ncbi:MAG: thiamine biosynthesis protein ThiS [Deltaproteobacteria bacterium]|nr:MAG: thiamine biosynthesis protein ThiS [Deltaproteobacteria bacterium]
MNLTVNGESFELGGADVPALVQQLGAVSEHVAIMLNNAIVPREEWDNASLTEGDYVEVLTFAAGG